MVVDDRKSLDVSCVEKDESLQTSAVVSSPTDPPSSELKTAWTQPSVEMETQDDRSTALLAPRDTGYAAWKALSGAVLVQALLFGQHLRSQIAIPVSSTHTFQVSL